MWAFIKTVSHHHRIVLGHGIAGVTYSEWRAVSSVGWVQLYPQPPLAPWPGARWGSGPLLWKENSVSFPVDTFKTITDSTQTLSAFYLHHARADPNNAGEHIPCSLPDRGLLPCFFPSCQRAVNTPPPTTICDMGVRSHWAVLPVTMGSLDSDFYWNLSYKTYVTFLRSKRNID